jgi:hypothetical protein
MPGRARGTICLRSLRRAPYLHNWRPRMISMFPRRKERKALTPAEQERLLSQRDTIQNMGAAQVSEQRRRLRRVRIGLERIVCSSNWADCNWFGTHMIVEVKGERVCRLVSAPYPPDGCNTSMTTCKNRRCGGRLYPASFITTSGFCWDCYHSYNQECSKEFGQDQPTRRSSVIDQRAMNRQRRTGRDYQP